MRNENFVSHKNFRWLWWHIMGVFACTLTYILWEPSEGHSGSSWLGYSLGGLATAAIALLMWYGIRKRSYSSHLGTLKGWLAVHIWLGLSLLIIVPLHSGFSFHSNIHSWAFYILAIVVLSGLWGAMNYRNLAGEIESNRGGPDLRTLITEELSLSDRIENQISQSSDQLVRLINRVDFKMPSSYLGILFRKLGTKKIDQKALEVEINRLTEGDRRDFFNLMKLLDSKRQFAQRIQKEVRTAAKLRLWLICHLPLSLFLVILVLIHIFSVFYFR